MKPEFYLQWQIVCVSIFLIYFFYFEKSIRSKYNVFHSFLLKGTRSSSRALLSRGFESNVVEVRITRNTYLERLLLAKKPCKRLARAVSADVVYDGNTSTHSPKPILKKPKDVPFGVKGRRKSHGDAINATSKTLLPIQPSSSAGAGPSTITFAPAATSTPIGNNSISNPKIREIQERLKEICQALNI